MLTASQVKDAAAKAALGRTWFGSKVWLCDVALHLNAPLHKLAADLVDLHRRREISLSRCDLAQLAPAGFVESSTITDTGSEWQLVRL